MFRRRWGVVRDDAVTGQRVVVAVRWTKAGATVAATLAAIEWAKVAPNKELYRYHWTAEKGQRL